MKIMAVDDESLMLERLCRCIREAAPEAEVQEFSQAVDALKYVEKEKVDVAFLDVQMSGMNGMELAKKIKVLQPEMNIIFSTGYGDYIYDAVSEIRCSGYILKPVTTEQIAKELANLRNPARRTPEAKIYIECFGNFEVFVNSEPLKFESAKAKELLAYLVDRKGAVCTNAEIMAALWEDDADHYSYLKKCKKNLSDILKKAGCEDLLIKRWGGIAVNKEMFSCDYYEWIEGTVKGINSYRGQYMAQYSWAENTNGSFSMK